MLFTDGTTNRVGIANNAPMASLDVNDAGGTYCVVMRNNDDSGPAAGFSAISIGSTGQTVFTGSSGVYKFKGGGGNGEGDTKFHIIAKSTANTPGDAQLWFSDENDAGTKTDRIYMGWDKGDDRFVAGKSSTWGANEYIGFNDTEVVINDDSTSVDFRVESNNLTHFLFCDNSTNRVGIATSAPMNSLQINHGNADGGDGAMIVRSDSTTQEDDWLGGIGFDSTDGDVPSSVRESSVYIGARAAEDHGSGDKGGYLVIGTSAIDENENTVSTERLRVAADGLVTLSDSIKIGGNVIKASDGGNTITLDTSDNVTIGNNLTVGGNIIKASDGGSTITMDTSDNVTIGNDLTVGGNVIRASDGGATITMDTSDNVTLGGTLTIPSYVYHASDTDTYRQFGVNTQIFVVGGTEKLRLNSDGTSIGTVTPVSGRELAIGSTSGARLSLRDTGAGSEADTLAFIDFWQAQSTKQLGYMGFAGTSNDTLSIYNKTTAGDIFLSASEDIAYDAASSYHVFKNAGNTIARFDLPRASTNDSSNAFIRFGYSGFQGDARIMFGDSSGGINDTKTGEDGKFMLASYGFMHDADGTKNYTDGSSAGTDYDAGMKTQAMAHGTIYPTENFHQVKPLSDRAVLINGTNKSFKVFFNNSTTYRAATSEFYVYFQCRIDNDLEEPNDEVRIWFLNAAGSAYNLNGTGILQYDNGSGGWTTEYTGYNNSVYINNVDDIDDDNWRWFRLKITDSEDITNLTGLEFQNTSDSTIEGARFANLTTRAMVENRYTEYGLRGQTRSEILSTQGTDWEQGTTTGDNENGTQIVLYAPPTAGRARIVLNYYDVGSHSHGQASAMTFVPGNAQNGNNAGAYGRIGIFDTTPDYTFDVIGDINASGEVRNSSSALTSDERLKENIEDMPDMLDKVIQLQPRLFDWKEGARPGRLDTEEYRSGDFGFIAQEMSAVLPCMVSVGQDKEKLQGVNYGKLTSVLAKAIQELNQKIVDLQAEVDSLKQ